MRTWSFGTIISHLYRCPKSFFIRIIIITMYLLFLFTIQIRKHFLLMTFLFFKTCIDSIDNTLLEFAKCRCIIISHIFCCCCCCCVLADRLSSFFLSILAFNPPNSFCILSISSLSLLCSFLKQFSLSFELVTKFLFLVQKSLLEILGDVPGDEGRGGDYSRPQYFLKCFYRIVHSSLLHIKILSKSIDLSSLDLP